jgi:hypothetical protein
LAHELVAAGGGVSIADFGLSMSRCVGVGSSLFRFQGTAPARPCGAGSVLFFLRPFVSSPVCGVALGWVGSCGGGGVCGLRVG